MDEYEAWYYRFREDNLYDEAEGPIPSSNSAVEFRDPTFEEVLKMLELEEAAA